MRASKKNAASAKISLFLSGFMLVFYGTVFYVIMTRFPNPESLLIALTTLYKTYGYTIIFFSAILEGLFLVGNYVPGTAAILLGAAIAKSGDLILPLVILVGTLGLMISYGINYLLGRYGWYHILSQFGMEKPLQIAEDKLSKHGGKAIFLGFISPNGAALLSTASGVVRMSVKKFFLFAILSQLFWSSVWGSVAYIFGNVFVEFVMRYFAVFIVVAVVGYFALRFIKKARTSQIP